MSDIKVEKRQIKTNVIIYLNRNLIILNRSMFFARIQRSTQTQEDWHRWLPTPAYKGGCHEVVPTEVRWYHLEQQSEISQFHKANNHIFIKLLILWNSICLENKTHTETNMGICKFFLFGDEF